MNKSCSFVIGVLIACFWISNILAGLCSCYYTDDKSSEAFKIESLIISYEKKREVEYLVDGKKVNEELK